jgi:hypothetical protein
MPIPYHPGLVSYGSGENRPSVIHQAVCFRPQRACSFAIPGPQLFRVFISMNLNITAFLRLHAILIHKVWCDAALLFAGPRNSFSQKRQLSTTLSHFSTQGKGTLHPKAGVGSLLETSYTAFRSAIRRGTFPNSLSSCTPEHQEIS